jgi:hypothetical protein
MQQYPRAHVLSSLAVVLDVTAPATIILTAHEIPALTVSYGDAA